MREYAYGAAALLYFLFDDYPNKAVRSIKLSSLECKLTCEHIEMPNNNFHPVLRPTADYISTNFNENSS